MSKRLSVDRRKEIFHALVTTQDVIPNVPRSRQIVTKKFGITEVQLKEIEDEGLEQQWPPLEESEEPVTSS
jgi:hypothetical protein